MSSTVSLEQTGRIAGKAQTAGKRRERMGPLARRRERWFYLMISPWIVGFILFSGGPIIASAAISFTRWSLVQSPDWIALGNYTYALFEDDLFWKVIKNTIYYSLGSVPSGLVVAFALALLLNEKVRGINFFRTIFFLPSVVSGVGVILLFGWIFNPRFGLINGMLARVGIKGPGWLYDPHWAMPVLIILSLYGVGGTMLIYLAGLQGVPQELYEAAEMDGAGTWARFRHITVPVLSPVTFLLLVTGIIGTFQVFTPAYVLTNGGPEFSTTTIGLSIYFNAFQYNKMGYAASQAWLLFATILVLTLVQFRLSKRWVHYEQEDRVK
ncbi:MAG: sugar ABC transporter permease [Anaerolineae bacterium]|nr:sugar ABC transporter permease [Anaerolineae bacterium]